MRQGLAFVRWVLLALLLGGLVFHVPLDACRPKVVTCLAASCCEADAPIGGADHAGATPASEDPDGCDQGCHCACCGRLPIAEDVPSDVTAGQPGVASSRAERLGARRSRPPEIFHPPRA